MNEGGNMVYMCQEMGIETGIALDALIEATLLAERIIGRPLGGQAHARRAPQTTSLTLR
jgi:hypothetical protein